MTSCSDNSGAGRGSTMPAPTRRRRRGLPRSEPTSLAQRGTSHWSDAPIASACCGSRPSAQWSAARAADKPCVARHPSRSASESTAHVRLLLAPCCLPDATMPSHTMALVAPRHRRRRCRLCVRLCTPAIILLVQGRRTPSSSIGCSIGSRSTPLAQAATPTMRRSTT